MRFVLFNLPLNANELLYWFMMQIGVSLGFITSYPVNWYLVKRGIKESMQIPLNFRK